MTCARCQAEIPAGARFCAACGAPVGAPCPKCTTLVFAGQRFCTGCGADVVLPGVVAAGAATTPTASPTANVVPAPVDDEGERRHATVMFSDLSGYTALNESFDPEEVESIMSRIKLEASEVVERHGGRVNQF